MGITEKSNVKYEKAITINWLVYLYIAYVAFWSFTDILSLPLFYIHHNELVVGAMAIALLIVVAAFKKLKEKSRFVPFQLNKLSIIFILIIIVISFIRSIKPDVSADVAAGRVLWQNPGFEDNINYNFFPASWTFYFPLPDRLFYIPKLLLGYRMGTTFNAFLLVLIFLQVRSIYQSLSSAQIEKVQYEYIRKIKMESIYGGSILWLNEDMFSFLSVMLFYSIADLGTYMIDITAIPILLWMIQDGIADGGDKKPPVYFIWIAFLSGLAFALKLTNIIFIFPLLLACIWKNRKVITLKLFLLCFLVGVLPALPYLIYSYKSTGNPVYFTFNSIFKSPYYSDTDFKDGRWGPSSLKEFILWPIHLIIHPGSHVSEISIWPQIYLFLGYVGIFYIFIQEIHHNNQPKAIKFLTLQSVIFDLLWLKTTGYPRYAIICEIISVILIVCCIMDCLLARSKIKRIIAICLAFCLTCQSLLNVVGGAINFYDWSFRGDVMTKAYRLEYLESIKMLFKDRDKIGTKEQQDKIGVFFSVNGTQSHMMMDALNKNAPLINGTYALSISGLKEEKGLDYKAECVEKLNKAESEGKKIYDISNPSNFINLDNPNLFGAEIVSIEEVKGYFTGRDTPLLIQYTMSGKQNTMTGIQQEQIYDLPEGTGKVRIKGIFCIPSYIRWETPDAQLHITVTGENGSKILLDQAIPNCSYFHLDDEYDVADLTGPLTVSVSDINGTDLSTVAINLEVIPQ